MIFEIETLESLGRNEEAPAITDSIKSFNYKTSDIQPTDRCSIFRISKYINIIKN